jgi:hypothetical protein
LETRGQRSALNPPLLRKRRASRQMPAPAGAFAFTGRRDCDMMRRCLCFFVDAVTLNILPRSSIDAADFDQFKVASFSVKALGTYFADASR